MPALRPRWFLLGLALAGAGCRRACDTAAVATGQALGDSAADASCLDGPGAVPDPDAPRVVVLVLDGVRTDESFGDGISSVTGEPTADFLPTVRSTLYPLGTLVTGAVATGVPITTEGHAELLTGMRQGLTTFPPATTVDTYKSDVPTLFEAVRATFHLDEDRVALYANTPLLADVTWSMAPGLGAAWGPHYLFETDGGRDYTDRQILDKLQGHLEAHDTRFAVANLHAMDLAGHVGEGTLYADLVKDVDAPIVAFWEWLSTTAPYAGHTTLVLLADHGRHRNGEPEDWRQHGDTCAGCVEIPLLFVGAGIRPGAVVDSPATLADVTQTLAELLGVDLPYGTGVVLGDVLEDPPVPTSRGEAFVAQSGDLVATQRWTGEAATRTEVVVDGEVLSTPGALHAEAPAVLETAEADYACWRERSVPPGEETTWTGPCRRRPAGGVWTDLAFPEPAVAALWEPDLHVGADGALWVAYAHNPYGYAGAASVRPRIARWRDGAWETAPLAGPELAYPSHVTATLTATGAIVAFAASDSDETGRDTRHVEVWAVAWPAGGTQQWTRLASFRATEAWTRFERPVLTTIDGGLHLAVTAYGAGGATIVESTSPDGATWSALTEVDPEARVLAHLPAVWTSAGDLVWARLGESGEVEIRRRSSAGVLTTIETGATAIEGLATGPDGVRVSLLDANGAWETTALGG